MTDHIEIDYKMIRDWVLGLLSALAGGAFGWFGVRHCTMVNGLKDCHFESGWPMYIALGFICWGFWLMSGDKFKEFVSFGSATVRGTPVRSSVGVPVIPEPPAK